MGITCFALPNIISLKKIEKLCIAGSKIYRKIIVQNLMVLICKEWCHSIRIKSGQLMPKERINKLYFTLIVNLLKKKYPKIINGI